MFVLPPLHVLSNKHIVRFPRQTRSSPVKFILDSLMIFVGLPRWNPDKQSPSIHNSSSPAFPFPPLSSMTIIFPGLLLGFILYCEFESCQIVFTIFMNSCKHKKQRCKKSNLACRNHRLIFLCLVGVEFHWFLGDFKNSYNKFLNFISYNKFLNFMITIFFFFIICVILVFFSSPPTLLLPNRARKNTRNMSWQYMWHNCWRHNKKCTICTLQSKLIFMHRKSFNKQNTHKFSEDRERLLFYHRPLIQYKTHPCPAIK